MKGLTDRIYIMKLISFCILLIFFTISTNASESLIAGSEKIKKLDAWYASLSHDSAETDKSKYILDRNLTFLQTQQARLKEELSSIANKNDALKRQKQVDGISKLLEMSSRDSSILSKNLIDNFSSIDEIFTENKLKS